MKSLAPRTPSKFSDSLHHQLNMYALAASAAGVGVLALSYPAEAKIVYTPANIEIYSGNPEYQLDLNHDGIADVTFWLDSSNDSVRFFASLRARPAKGNEVEGWGGYASALQRGVQIGGKNHFRGAGSLMACVYSIHSRGRSTTCGPWMNVVGRYLGIMFQIKGKRHYGWARLSVGGGGGSLGGVLTGYAYETIPNKPIITGKEHRADDETEQPSTLGRLALGRR